MRGADSFTQSPFMLHRLENFAPAVHSLGAIRQSANEALHKMNASFVGMYATSSKSGRPSIAPKKLLCAILLQVF